MRLIIIKDDIAVMSKIYDDKLIASFSDIAKVHGTTKTRLWKEFKRIKRNVLPFNEVEDYHIIDSYDAKSIGIFENLFPSCKGTNFLNRNFVFRNLSQIM
jgi:hypothetical protein